MNKTAKQARLAELQIEVKRVTNNPTLSREQKMAFFSKVEAEAEEITSGIKAYDEANRLMAAAEAAMGGSQVPSGGHRMGDRICAASPMDLSQSQLQGLMTAAERRTPYSVEIQPKAFRFRDDVQTKTAVLESGITGSLTGQLPAVQSLYAVGIGYEPTRIANLLPGAAMPGPSASWLTHVSNGSEVAAVSEGGSKSDISAVVSNSQVIPTKIAGQVSVSLEAWQDTGAYGEGSFASWLPTELTRSLINEESNVLLNGVSGTANLTFNGILNTSGTLTRAMGTDSPLDCLSKAYADLRVGAAFADPDLVIMHPNTLGALRRAKDADGRYILDLLAGPLALSAYGQPTTGPTSERNEYSIIPQGVPGSSGTLWGASIFTSTQIAAGSAIVASIKAGAGIFWQRLGLLIMFDPYTLLTNNEYRWIAEERIAYSCPRPAALNLVTGLPTS